MQRTLQPLRHAEQKRFVDDSNLLHASDPGRNFRSHVGTGRGPRPHVLGVIHFATPQACGLHLHLPASGKHRKQPVRSVTLSRCPKVVSTEAVTSQSPQKH
jgi:hypothetical protein